MEKDINTLTIMKQFYSQEFLPNEISSHKII